MPPVPDGAAGDAGRGVGRAAGGRPRPDRLAAALVLALSLLACRTPPPRAEPAVEPLDVRAERELEPVLDSARAAAARGAHARADTALERFCARFAGTPAAAEAVYWRALLRLDPDNAAVATGDAVRALDAYNGIGGAPPRTYETAIFRRLLAQLDSLRATVAAQRREAALQVPRDSLRSREQALQLEIDQLRAELERVTAELARVRRRLAPPGRR